MEFRPMSPEEIERTMQFLLSQQAQFSADFAKLEVKVDRATDAVLGLTGSLGHLTGVVDQLTGVVDQVTGTVGQLTGTVGQLTGVVDQLTGTMGQLAGTVGQLTGTMGQLTGTMGELAERQAETEHLVLEQRRETDRRFADFAVAHKALAEAQMRTEDNLNALIVTFERHLREDHGHGPS